MVTIMDSYDFVSLIVAVFSSSGLTSLILYLVQRHDRKKDERNRQNSTQTKMLIGLGHDRILSLTDRYVKRGGVTLKELRNLEYLWQPYEAMGGNGDCKIGYDAVQLLPKFSEEKAEVTDALDYRKQLGLKGDDNN